MENQTIDILGTKYNVEIRNANEDPQLSECDGYCDWTLNLITIEKFKPEIHSIKDLDKYSRKVLRHEILHCFVRESGLAESSSWARNEEMIDFFAIQFEKIYDIFKKANALEVNI